MHAKGVSLNSPAHFGLATADVSIACRFPRFPCPAGWLPVTILNDIRRQSPFLFALRDGRFAFARAGEHQ